MPLQEMTGSDADSQEQQVTSLQREVDRLRAAADDCSKVLYHLIHDLRGPIRTMLTHAQLLERKHQDVPSLKEYLETIYEGAREATAVLDSSSVFFKTNSNPSLSTINLRLPIDLALMQVKSLLDTAKANIEIGTLPEASADIELLSKVFEHVLRNALLYRRTDGTPHVTVTGSEYEGHVEVRVGDNGQGIAPEKVEAVFQPFVREHGRGYPGVGMGLAIARKYVVAHGGTIRAESDGATGTTIILTLPL